MSDEELIERLLMGYDLHVIAASRIEKLVKESEQQAALLGDAYGAILDWDEVLKQRADHEAVQKIERLEAALREIDALDPECERIGACSENAIRGLVLRMGEIARAALKGDNHE